MDGRYSWGSESSVGVLNALEIIDVGNLTVHEQDLDFRDVSSRLLSLWVGSWKVVAKPLLCFEEELAFLSTCLTDFDLSLVGKAATRVSLRGMSAESHSILECLAADLAASLFRVSLHLLD